jgi:hypothetical protein
MNITLTIPDNQASRLINALCVRYGYQETIPTEDENGVLIQVSNPQTKTQFAKQSLINLLKEITKEEEYKEQLKSISTPEEVTLT